MIPEKLFIESSGQAVIDKPLVTCADAKCQFELEILWTMWNVLFYDESTFTLCVCVRVMYVKYYY